MSNKKVATPGNFKIFLAFDVYIFQTDRQTDTHIKKQIFKQNESIVARSYDITLQSFINILSYDVWETLSLYCAGIRGKLNKSFEHRSA